LGEREGKGERTGGKIVTTDFHSWGLEKKADVKKSEKGRKIIGGTASVKEKICLRKRENAPSLFFLGGHLGKIGERRGEGRRREKG